MGITHSINDGEETERVLTAGRPNFDRCDNKTITAKYTAWSFLPMAIREQFRRLANVYFLCIAIIMIIGQYTSYYTTAMSPWTILGPLSIVISVSLVVEGYSDTKRHASDEITNNAKCIILRRADEINRDNDAERDTTIIRGKDVLVNLSKKKFRQSINTVSTPDHVLPTNGKPHLVQVAFQKIKRMDIRQGHIILIRNREAVPADTVILATSGENGCAYIETSSIDGETNLKLRNSPTIPSIISKNQYMEEVNNTSYRDGDGQEKISQSLEKATKNVTRFSALAYPLGVSAVDNTGSSDTDFGNKGDGISDDRNLNNGTPLLTTLISEPPNSHVNTFSGKLVFPSLENECIEVPLGAENILLRGGILRNTEWVLGLSCFTGRDTKLIRNSFQTPSKFSRIDVLINKCVVLIVTFMCICIGYLSLKSMFVMNEKFDELWYIGFNQELKMTWPYLPNDLPPPNWANTSNNALENFLMFVTLLSNFVPLSMYVTLEMVNFFCLWLVYVDDEMYDPKTDTRALARSTNVTDLGQIQYIFSDKTGTLTQNIMRFKRCSVDGMIFGAPIQKMRPQSTAVDDSSVTAFHPKRQLVVGKISYNAGNNRVKASNGMTFNAEMFVRVMSLCHTVMVEKDLDNRVNIDESKSVSSSGSSWKFPVSIKKKHPSNNLSPSTHVLETVSEEPNASVSHDLSEKSASRSSLASMIRGGGGESSCAVLLEKNHDGAPAGFAYQAESPDESALVSEASKTFGFQVIGRNSSGITLRCEHPTVLSDKNLVSGLRNGTISSRTLVSNCATGSIQVEKNEEERLKYTKNLRIETWEILAVNKFDSERKRMSILLRSPAELGGAVILFCKGADSAMLNSAVCCSSGNLLFGNAFDLEKTQQLETTEDENDDTEWDTAQLLGIQSHLGEFASEGLRTLVLGIRFLTDKDCEIWLKTYQKAASSLQNRDAMLRNAAIEIEKEMHIVGATAVEDRLQFGVPDTIATLARAGIKLWVLTGDKKETAIEIGYSTKVLSPRMHLTEVTDQGIDFVRAQCAMEFMHLVKAGKLPLYQKVAIEQSNSWCFWENAVFVIGKKWHAFLQFFLFAILTVIMYVRKTLGFSSSAQEKALKNLHLERNHEKEKLQDNIRRRNVRYRAEKIIKDFRKACAESLHNQALPRCAGKDSFDLSNDDLPNVFNRAESARSVIRSRDSDGEIRSSSVRNIRISQLTAQEFAEKGRKTEFDEDMLSLKSICLATSDIKSHFDRKKRTVLERLFAVDRDVRKGRLLKHVKNDEESVYSSIPSSSKGPRALIIEGNALKHLLGDRELEELLFNIASQCDAVIACRVSPQQKALLVKLVRNHSIPEPVTLAIGDGANDVGMIQEAHVGIGISGKEGKQAVNASDFAIAQFRFLESLILIHGRWDFMRLATVVLFSFYKNAVMAGCLIVYNGWTLYSGQSLFDQWVISVFNFVVFFPIFFLGIFDRCLEKDYIRKNPVVYRSTRQNEVLTMRVLLRWIFMTVSQIMILCFGTLYYTSAGGGNTSSHSGLMRFHSRIGDGEGGDLKSVGLIIFSSMVLMLAYKVLYESRTIINGKWPPCFKSHKDGFWNRVPYSWYGITYGSIYFYFLFFLPIYNKINNTTKNKGPDGFFDFVGTMPHVLGTSSVNYISFLFIPIAGMAFDICWKVFSNMFYPTQTQIHVELESIQFTNKRNIGEGNQKTNHSISNWRA